MSTDFPTANHERLRQAAENLANGSTWAAAAARAGIEQGELRALARDNATDYRKAYSREWRGAVRQSVAEGLAVMRRLMASPDDMMAFKAARVAMSFATAHMRYDRAVAGTSPVGKEKYNPPVRGVEPAAPQPPAACTAACTVAPVVRPAATTPTAAPVVRPATTAAQKRKWIPDSLLGKKPAPATREMTSFLDAPAG